MRKLRFTASEYAYVFANLMGKKDFGGLIGLKAGIEGVHDK